MARQKHLARILRLFAESPVVGFSSIARLIGDEGYAKQVVNTLVKRGTIRRLAKGSYTARDDLNVAVFAFKPAYLGLQSALSVHGLWEQETIPIILTTSAARVGVRQVGGANILVRRLDKRRFFGFDYVQEGGSYVPYSDVEKTLIDLVAFRQRLPPEVAASFRKRVDPAKLQRYLRRYPPRTRANVLRLVFPDGSGAKKR